MKMLTMKRPTKTMGTAMPAATSRPETSSPVVSTVVMVTPWTMRVLVSGETSASSRRALRSRAVMSELFVSRVSSWSKPGADSGCTWVTTPSLRTSAGTT